MHSTDENFVQKAGASQAAAAHGVALIAPDTSPRNAEPVDGENDSYDFGSAAGFYIDATEKPWCDAGESGLRSLRSTTFPPPTIPPPMDGPGISKLHSTPPPSQPARAHADTRTPCPQPTRASPGYAMETYVTEELPALAAQIDGIDTGVASIMGHSMGGHGALSLGFKSVVNGGPVRFRSISAFSPICHPTNGAWGQKAFEGYLGSVEAGEPHDATLIMKGASGAAADALRDVPLLVHTGGADNFYHDGQLQPEALQEAMEAIGRADTGMVKLEEGYDHSYFFISSFVRIWCYYQRW